MSNEDNAKTPCLTGHDDYQQGSVGAYSRPRFGAGSEGWHTEIGKGIGGSIRTGLSQFDIPPGATGIAHFGSVAGSVSRSADW